MTYSAFLQQFPTSLSKREKQYTKILTIKKKNNIPTSPLERGRGCVTPVHSHLKIKSNHQKPTNATSPNSRKTISSQPAHLTVTHPFNPLSRGETSHSTHSLPNRKSASQTSPLESEVPPKSWTGYTLSGNGKGSVLYRALSL